MIQSSNLKFCCEKSSFFNSLNVQLSSCGSVLHTGYWSSGTCQHTDSFLAVVLREHNTWSWYSKTFELIQTLLVSSNLNHAQQRTRSTKICKSPHIQSISDRENQGKTCGKTLAIVKLLEENHAADIDISEDQIDKDCLLRHSFN